MADTENMSDDEGSPVPSTPQGFRLLLEAAEDRRHREEQLKWAAVEQENERLKRELQLYKTRQTHAHQDTTGPDDGQVQISEPSPEPSPPPGNPSPDLTTVIAKLVDALDRKNEGLPRKEPNVFRGDTFEFPVWRNAFKVLVMDRYSDATDRCYYLGKYTSGEARKCVEGLLALNTQSAFDQALAILNDRYGNKLKLAKNFRDKIDKWPMVRYGDGKGLQDLADFLAQCKTAMGTLAQLNILDDPSEQQKIIAKLPKFIQDRWLTIVDNHMYGDNHSDGQGNESYPPFSKFVDFIRRQARIACNPIVDRSSESTGRSDKTTPAKPQTVKKSSASAFTSGTSPQEDSANGTGTPSKRDGQTFPSTNRNTAPTCPKCEQHHYLDCCPSFKEMTLPQRTEFVKKGGLCFGCFRKGHRKGDCRKKKQCQVCKLSHPTLLHDYARQTDATNGSQGGSTDVNVNATLASATSHCVDVNECVSHSLIVPVVLHHVDDPCCSTVVYALLDDQSDSCFVSDSILQQIGVTGSQVELKLSTVLGEKVIACQKVNGLVIRGLRENDTIQLPGTYTRESIPAKHSQIPIPSTVQKWPHLEGVATQLTPYLSGVEVGLLIGTNCSRALKPREVVCSNDEDEPYAIHTSLGWGVIGMMCKDGSYDGHESTCNQITTAQTQNECHNQHFVHSTRAKEISPLQVTRMFETDFNERTGDQELSIEDRRFLKTVTEGIHTTESGHLEMPLPFKDEKIRLPNNRSVAVKRLNGLKGRIAKDPEFRRHYTDFMSKLIANGYAERVPEEELSIDDGTVWYVPHHGVYHPHKEKKIRVVFDCSAEFQGEVLNRHLLPGPDLINNLTGILLRFRKGQIGVACDIEAMFHQVSVNREDRNFLRFLWWDKGLDQPPSEFRMTVHLFGATSSPGCANFALKTAANLHEGKYGKEAADFIRDDFYVDDGIRSVDSTLEAVQLIKSATAMCAESGFRLHKFVSNSKEVLDSVQSSERGKNVQDMDLQHDVRPLERTLGMQWCIESDTFQFRVSLQDKPLTRRGILSTVSSIYDPLGLVSPFLLIGKTILQELCKSGSNWDDPVPDDIRVRWERWRLDLEVLSTLRIPRTYTATPLSEMKTVELHNFSDASLSGYGECSYLRTIDSSGNIQSSLVMSKARVAPTKSVTVPRLELTAALTSAKVGKMLDQTLKVDDLKQFYYTDSKVVLGYISNESKRFQVFVANRVQGIRDLTSLEQWRHVETALNPADIASRGATAKNLISSQLWWSGPPFLQTNDVPLPVDGIDVPLDDPELRKVATALYVRTTEVDVEDMMHRFSRFSSWFRLKKAVAICIKYIEKLKIAARKSKDKATQTVTDNLKGTQVTVEELQHAEVKIIRIAQAHGFPNELKGVSKEENKLSQVSSNSPIYNLDPFLDADGCLRVGGRIKRSNLPPNVKHPIVLPRNCHISNLLVKHHHRITGHSGRMATLNGIKEAGYWILRARAVVTTHIMNCVVCRKLRGTPCQQKMGDLPKDRMATEPPFTYTGVDFFGPYLVKSGRKELKRWGALFTCLASRSIHLEVSYTMDTDSFLNAYRRFVCRRGPVRLLRCDRGTNFIGGKNELDKALDEMDQDKVTKELLKDNCDYVTFQPNVPHSSHMGGVWERMIRCVRSTLSSLLAQHSQQLDDELLQTLLAEVEAIVNSRPLTFLDTESPESLQPVSPSQILTLKSKVVMPPPGIFVREDLYIRRRWRRVQYLANLFWTKWKAEFLTNLQERKKWHKPTRNLTKDDVVLVMDENLARCQWPLGRIVETYPGEDGLTRKVKVKVGKTELERPIHKLILLVAREVPAEEPTPDNHDN